MQAIGFDMDYTLAQYRVETFEALAHKQTVDKLVGIGRGWWGLVVKRDSLRVLRKVGINPE